MYYENGGAMWVNFSPVFSYAINSARISRVGICFLSLRIVILFINISYGGPLYLSYMLPGCGSDIFDSALLSTERQMFFQEIFTTDLSSEACIAQLFFTGLLL